MNNNRSFFLGLLLSLLLSACGGGSSETGQTGLSGTVAVDGSSTVFPITEAVAEEFQREFPRVRVTVGISGTGGGFKRFVVGETDINDASRPIQISEAQQAAQNSVEFIELPVAFDGITIVVHPSNDFVDFLTVEELRKIWQPGSNVQSWHDVRSSWPDRPLNLYGAGTDSGTFDYFTEAINGESGASRPDFTASEDDNMLVQGVSGDPNALGFFGYAYYAENQSLLKVIPVDGGEGPVVPSQETINEGTYQPLSRPVFIYVSRSSADRAEVAEFVDFYLRNAPVLAREVGYVPLPQPIYDVARSRFEQNVTGSLFSETGTAGISLEEVLGVWK